MSSAAEARLTAVLATPRDVTLTWQAGDPMAAGRIVEFATEPQGQYTILDFLPASRTTYTHPDLIPKTTFYYRLRPYSGPISNQVEITLPAGPLDESAQHDWLDPRTVGPKGKTPGAAPTNLRATIKHANGIAFTWQDNSSDEEGYLLEIRAVGGKDFRVAAVLDPDVNAFGLITLPQEKRATYRVRAFWYGKPSTVVNQTTG